MAPRHMIRLKAVRGCQTAQLVVLETRTPRKTWKPLVAPVPTQLPWKEMD